MKTIKTLSLLSLLALSIGITSCNADEPTPPKKRTNYRRIWHRH